MVRKMGSFEVTQRTKDGMFNATSLLNEWNKIPGNPQRDLSKFWQNLETRQFISNLTGKYCDIKKSARSDNFGTWMRLDLFMYFILWVDPLFEYHLIKMFIENSGDISDMINSNKTFNYNTFTYVFKLKNMNTIYKIGKSKGIKHREKQLADIYGDLDLIFVFEKNIENYLHIKFKNKRYEYLNTKELFHLNDDDLIWLGMLRNKINIGDQLYKAITHKYDVDYNEIYKLLNYIVFGKHEPELRQQANEDQLKELTDIQNKLAFAVDMGYIRSYEQLLNEMRIMWHKKYKSF